MPQIKAKMHRIRLLASVRPSLWPTVYCGGWGIPHWGSKLRGLGCRLWAGERRAYARRQRESEACCGWNGAPEINSAPRPARSHAQHGSPAAWRAWPSWVVASRAASVPGRPGVSQVPGRGGGGERGRRSVSVSRQSIGRSTCRQINNSSPPLL